MPPGIEITWLPSRVPTGHWKNEIAVPEGTSVGSQGFQSLAAATSQSPLLRHPLRDTVPPLTRSRRRANSRTSRGEPDPPGWTTGRAVRSSRGVRAPTDTDYDRL